ncbi:MAG: hypothetical protein DRQ14_01455 [Candidatus Latescibacterota bacterium]|nr:MAG: hypothetical protein DRQ14_01455 [Candidatus Latescibacterota bacterium]
MVRGGKMLSDILPKRVEVGFHFEPFRSPLKFGAVVMEGLTYCTVEVEVEDGRGRTARGNGSMPLADMWAFPSPKVPHELRESAMREVALRFARKVEGYGRRAHPVDIFLELEDELAQIGRDVSREMGLAEELPFLALLVSASAVDAALHDAFGKVNGICSYDGYGKDFMEHDLGYYLGEEFRGKYIGDYLRSRYLSELPVFHLVGGLDVLRKGEVPEDAPQDGLPNSLEEWVERDGLFCLKVKLRGKDLEWDVRRTLEVAEVAREVRRRMGWDDRLYLSVDTNEQCESPEYMVEYLKKVEEKDPRTYEEILYLEQPTERDLSLHRWDMRKLSSLKPVVIDESLATLDDYRLARQLGWSGVALKTCKCHSSALLFVCLAEEEGVPYTVQDLTLYGTALVHSVGFAARIRTMMGVESNGCQYHRREAFPEVRRLHPGVMERREGKVRTDSIGEVGLGFRIE